MLRCQPTARGYGAARYGRGPHLISEQRLGAEMEGGGVVREADKGASPGLVVPIDRECEGMASELYRLWSWVDKVLENGPVLAGKLQAGL